MIDTLNPETADVLIVGAGPAGLSLATALADAGMTCTLVERQPLDEIAAPRPDGREIALTHRSRAILRRLGIWDRIAAEDISPIREARVINGGSPFALQFDARTDRDGDSSEPLGFLVPNSAIRRAAYEATVGRGGVSLVAGVQATSVSTDGRDGTGGVAATLADGSTRSARLLVAADSRFSETRRRLGIGAEMRDFGRSAIVCRMAHDTPHGAAAQECFLYGLTLAVLPLNGDVASIVVTAPTHEAAALMQSTPEAFARRIEETLRGRLGSMRLVGERTSYPLVAVYAHRFAARRSVLIGDSAVGMHPVTAHGFNFGLYGVETLVRVLREARHRGRDIGDAAVLQAFESEHRRATLPIYLGTNAVVRLFTDDRMPARALRAAVLRFAEHLPPLKAGITRQLTGKGAPRMAA